MLTMLRAAHAARLKAKRSRHRLRRCRVHTRGDVESAGHTVWPGSRGSGGLWSVPDTGRQVSPALHGVAPESGVLEFAMESGYQHALYFSLRYLAMYARWVTK
jgi:hypothetical protein